MHTESRPRWMRNDGKGRFLWGILDCGLEKVKKINHEAELH